MSISRDDLIKEANKEMFNNEYFGSVKTDLNNTYKDPVSAAMANRDQFANRILESFRSPDNPLIDINKLNAFLSEIKTNEFNPEQRANFANFKYVIQVKAKMNNNKTESLNQQTVNIDVRPASQAKKSNIDISNKVLDEKKSGARVDISVKKPSVYEQQPVDVFNANLSSASLGKADKIVSEIYSSEKIYRDSVNTLCMMINAEKERCENKNLSKKDKRKQDDFFRELEKYMEPYRKIDLLSKNQAQDMHESGMFERNVDACLNYYKNNKGWWDNIEKSVANGRDFDKFIVDNKEFFDNAHNNLSKTSLGKMYIKRGVNFNVTSIIDDSKKRSGRVELMVQSILKEFPQEDGISTHPKFQGINDHLQKIKERNRHINSLVVTKEEMSKDMQVKAERFETIQQKVLGKLQLLKEGYSEKDSETVNHIEKVEKSIKDINFQGDASKLGIVEVYKNLEKSLNDLRANHNTSDKISGRDKNPAKTALDSIEKEIRQSKFYKDVKKDTAKSNFELAERVITRDLEKKVTTKLEASKIQQEVVTPRRSM